MSENEKPVEKPSQSDENSKSDETNGLPDKALEQVSGGAFALRRRRVAVTGDPCDGGEITVNSDPCQGGESS